MNRNKTFVGEDFLLSTRRSRELFHNRAERLPIIDYHCHLCPADIANDRRFDNLTQAWLEGDHYKWRAMRTCGVDERYITGEASDREKFMAWADVVPKTLRNPLYHWTHLELSRHFGINDRLLNPETAPDIWDTCTEQLSAPGSSVRSILRRMKVEIVCTTDDPVDGLEHHRRIAADDSFPVIVLPTFRADRAMALENPDSWRSYMEVLGTSAGLEIRSYADLLAALRRRHDYFHRHGCRLSDHGLETIYCEEYTQGELNSIVGKAISGKATTPKDQLKLKSALLYDLAVMDWEKEWVQQFHLGALRNTNERMLHTLGPDTGFDSIGDADLAKPLAKFLNRLDKDDELARTILYNLNPRDNEMFAAMIGNFQDGSVHGKVQYGAAWWFLDNENGIRRQIDALSSLGMLSRFVGMLTDSRSVLSYPRHEYFRRILCGILGEEMENGRLPNDLGLVGEMVSDICYGNARSYFGFHRSESVSSHFQVPAVQTDQVIPADPGPAKRLTGQEISG